MKPDVQEYLRKEAADAEQAADDVLQGVAPRAQGKPVSWSSPVDLEAGVVIACAVGGHDGCRLDPTTGQWETARKD
jgi:hypothetical protein